MTDGLLSCFFPEPLDQGSSDRPWRAHTDGPIIDFDNRNHLGGTAGQKALVSHIEVMSGECQFFDGDPGFCGKVHDDLPRDSCEDSRVDRGCKQSPGFDDENVISRSLSDVPLGIQHQRLHTACTESLHFGQDIIQVIQTLDPGANRRGMISYRTGGDDFETVFVELIRIERNMVRDGNDLRMACSIGVQP